ncbi:DUF7519 family protein [Halopiger goleimassiliensis]|uniref:DUF7519 family protein n=1 Tax=Halopiger goleimassiliensis TaxID=1293048 RepID=UPI0006781F93|nr:hypothetical protein [Halopiger goleimassiliensis]
MATDAGRRSGSTRYDRRESRQSGDARTRDRRRAETVSAPVTAIATIVAALSGVLVLAFGADVLLPGVVAAVAGGLLTATVTATKRRTPGGRAVGSVLVVLTAIAITAAVGLTALGGLSLGIVYRVGLVVAIGVAAFGATATLTGAIGDGAVRSALPITTATSLPLVLVAAIYSGVVDSLVPDRRSIGGVDTGVVSEPLLSPDGIAAATATFVLLAVATLWTVWIVLPRLPIVEFVPRDRRAEAREWVSRIATASLHYGFVVLLLGLTAAALLVGREEITVDVVANAADLLETILEPIATSRALRLLLLWSIAAFVAAYVISRLPGLYRLRHSSLVAWTPVLTGGVLTATLIAVAYPTLFERLLAPELEALAADGVVIPNPLGGVLTGESLYAMLAPPGGVAVAAVAMMAAVGTAGLVVGLIWLTGAVALLPDRAAPGSVVAGALVLGSVLAGVDGAGTLVVAIPVASAIVAWDAAVYGVSITEELGADAPVRRPALVHVTGAAVVGLASVALAVGLTALAERLTARTGVTIVLSLTVALLAVWIVLKRRATRRAVESARADRRDSGRSGTTPRERRSEPAAPRERPRRSQETDRPNEAVSDPDREISTTTVPVLAPGDRVDLEAAGYETVGDLQKATAAELAAVEGLHPRKATAIKRAVDAGIDGDDTGSDDG